MRIIRYFAVSAAVLCAMCTVSGADNDHPVARPFDTVGPLGEPSFAIPYTRAPLQTTDPLITGADHIVSQQCDNGGFGWPHADCSATFHNLTGPILLGVLGAHNHTGIPEHLLAATNGGAWDLTSTYDNGESRFGTLGPFFMWRLSRAAGNTTFSTFVETELFDELEAGTYGPNDVDTAGWISEIKTYRTGTWVNLRPWEFQTLGFAARTMGNAGQEALFEQAVLDGLATLNNSDPDTVYSDILGVAGAVRGLADARRYTFPAVSAPLHTGVDGIGSLEDLAAYLGSLQNGDGSWYWHSNLTTAGVGDEDVQTTAYAVLALLKVDILTAASYEPSYTSARDWLVSMMGADGGIPSNPGGAENTEVEGEALTAIAAVDALLFLDGFEAGDFDLWTTTAP